MNALFWILSTAIVATVSLAAQAGETSVSVGSISQSLKDGYRLVNGSALSEEHSNDVAVTETAPYSYAKRKSRQAVVYLEKDKTARVCEYAIVTANPSLKSQDYGRPWSQCYDLK